ncbi:MAG: NAD(P)-binding protein, partial [Planctomycetales bacterium]|nr:NAD(P)-binding protein [Planctomycetales bacterium]
CFDKSIRPGGRSTSRRLDGACQFDHGAQYFTIRTQNLRHYLASWSADSVVAPWPGRIVSIDQPQAIKPAPPETRYVATPCMQALAQHLAKDLSIQFECEVACAKRSGTKYQLFSNDRQLGAFDIVLWNCPPAQVSRQVPAECSWTSRLSAVKMLPCWAVMLALNHSWEIPLDGAFVNQGGLSWMARDSSKPERKFSGEGWVLHSTAEWARQNLEVDAQTVVQMLTDEAQRMTGSQLPKADSVRAHRWLYARPDKPLPENSLWDSDNWLGCCGDWCGGPRVEGALLSGMALAGRVLGTLHEHKSTMASTMVGKQSKPTQLMLFDE